MIKIMWIVIVPMIMPYIFSLKHIRVLIGREKHCHSYRAGLPRLERQVLAAGLTPAKAFGREGTDATSSESDSNNNVAVPLRKCWSWLIAARRL